MKVEEKLLKACLSGNVEDVKECLKLNVNVNSQNDLGSTPLHYACHSQNIEIIKLLLNAKADINISNNDGVTALHIASKRGNVQIAKLLIEKGIDVNKKTVKGVTALHMACSEGHEEMVKLLIEGRANLDIQEERGNTALHGACYNKNINIVNSLIDNGANVNIQNNNKVTPLHIASCMDDDQIAKSILNANADINLRDTTLSTPLHIATENGNEKIARLIILKNKQENDNPVEYLNIRDICGRTALENVVKRSALGNDIDKKDMITVFLQEGAKANRKVVDWAVQHKNTDIIRSLSEQRNIVAYLIKKLIVTNEKELLKEIVKNLKNEGKRISTIERVDDISVLGEAIKSQDLEIADMFMKNNSNTVHEKIVKLKELAEDDSASLLLMVNRNDAKKTIENRKREREQENILDLLYTGGNHIKKASINII